MSETPVAVYRDDPDKDALIFAYCGNCEPDRTDGRRRIDGRRPSAPEQRAHRGGVSKVRDGMQR
jgi:hypothetical protein